MAFTGEGIDCKLSRPLERLEPTVKIVIYVLETLGGPVEGVFIDKAKSLDFNDSAVDVI